MYFWIYLIPKMLLDRCLKSTISEDPSTSNMVKSPKHCWNFNDSTFTIFIDHCEGNSVGKSLSEWYAKSYDCFLTYWLPRTNILFLIETIFCNIFRCNYLRNNRVFRNFFAIWKSTFNFKHFQKNMTLIDDVFFKLQTPKKVVR